MYQRLSPLFLLWASIQATAFLSFNVLSARLALRPVNYRWAAGPRHAAAPAVAPVKSCCSPAFRSTYVQFLVISDNQASLSQPLDSHQDGNKHWPHQDCTLFSKYKSWINPDIKGFSLKGSYINEQMWVSKGEKRHQVILDTDSQLLSVSLYSDF